MSLDKLWTKLQRERLSPTRHSPGVPAPSKNLASVVQQYQAEQVRLQAKRQQHLEQLLRDSGTDVQRTATGPATAARPSADRIDEFRPPVSYFAVPANVRDLVALPDARREQFLTHLRQVTQAAFDEAPPRAHDCAEHGTQESATANDQALVAPDPIPSAACGTCQGYCCRHGAHHAFYSSDHIQRLRVRLPSLSAAGIVDLIAGYLPPRSFENSCVMHGPQGCHLPREYRAELCNHFECSDLVHIIRHVSDQPSVIVAVAENRLVRRMEITPSRNCGATVAASAWPPGDATG